MEYVQELLDYAFSPGRLVGHLSYVLLILSMLMRSMTRLRLIAISSGVVSIIYGIFWLHDPVTIFWESIFVATNLVQLLILAWENKRALFSEDEQKFFDVAVPNVEKAHAKRLLKIGKWCDAAVGETLISEGKVASHLIFIAYGTARIEAGGRMVGVCGHHDFIGEISFMSNRPATATAIVTNSVRYLCFERQSLTRLLDKDKEIRFALESSFNRNLVEKLVKSNEGK